jgi:16S rRNA (guanine527-N7)-methyltransferase
MDPTDRRLAALVGEHGLERDVAPALRTLLDLIAIEPASITAIRDPRAGADAHVADALSGLRVDELRAARRIVDLGSGAGIPGIVLALALPTATVALIESTARKAAFLAAAVAALGLGARVEVVADRAESWPDGLGRAGAVTARAVGPLAVLLEYAAPLLARSGALVAWKGRCDPAEVDAAVRAAAALGMSPPAARRVEPFPGAGERYLYISSKVKDTPPNYPRRPGMASKRPLGRSPSG